MNKSSGKNKGYVLISRGLLEHQRFRPCGALTQFEAWYWLIEKAAYVARTVTVINGRHHAAVSLLPGQLTYSVRYLTGAWKWSDKRVQRFLAALESDGSISTKTSSGQTVFTLCNWAKYQRPNAEISADQATTQSATQKADATTTQTEVVMPCDINTFRPNKIEATTQTEDPATTQTTTNKKERKEKKKDIAPCGSGFAEWYSIYPKKKSRQDAERAFAKVISSGLIALPDLMEKTRAFAAAWAAEPKERRQFIPYPASWLRDGGYDDEPEGGEPASAPINPRSFDDTAWRKRLTYFQEAEKWLDAWGPEPGKPGCLVPAHLLLSPVSASKGAA